MNETTYDFLVIGGGSGGVRAARIAAGHGAKVAIAEASDLGGTCVNLGCIPKKLFVYAADFSKGFKDAKAFGWRGGRLRFEWNRLVTAKNTEIKRLNGIYKKMLEESGADIINGYARFVDPHTVEINGRRIKADKILIATGGQPRKPEFPGKEHVVVSDDMFHLPSLPKKAVIIGAGYIGLEFAHILNGLGVKVTLIDRNDLPLRGFDIDLRKTLAEEIKKDGIDILAQRSVAKVEKNGRKLVLHTDKGDKVECGLVLAALGRTPNSAGLNLAAAGVNTDQNGKIVVDSEYRTNVDHIHAVGDVANSHNLTPVATGEGHALADRLFAKPPTGRKVSYDIIPTAVFSQPPIATAGISEDEAKQRGIDYLVYKTGFRPLKHTVTGRDEKTLMKLIVDKKSDRVIGCHMIGADAPEIMQGFAVAMNAGATKADFDRTIGIHPTSAEEFVTLRKPSPPN